MKLSRVTLFDVLWLGWKALVRSSLFRPIRLRSPGADPIRHTAVLVLMRVSDLGADQVVWSIVLTVKENAIQSRGAYVVESSPQGQTRCR